MTKARFMIAFVLLVAAVGTTRADLPPDLVNYQGVLRDAAGRPQDGTFDMVFRFFDDAVAGNEILVDEHRNAAGLGVIVAGGMFDVRIGTGIVSDGTGPGTFSDLASVFKNHGSVFVQIEVNGEVLDPRVRVASAAYALNATNLGGLGHDEYLNTNGTVQTKTGRLIVDASGAVSDFGITAYGPSGGAYFADSDSGASARLGYGNRGLEAYGSYTGAYFQSTGGTATTYVAQQNTGIDARGGSTGGFFQNLGDGAEGWAAQGGYGLKGFGPTGGGYFADQGESGWAAVAYGHLGIWAQGGTAGALFQDADASGYAYLGYGDRGIEAFGGNTAGYFQALSGNAYAYLAAGTYGISAYGTTAGGSFDDIDSPAHVRLAFGSYGIDATGNGTGGVFRDAAGSGMAWLANGDEGVRGAGNLRGGYFYDRNATGEAYLGVGDYGIQSFGTSAGGYFYEDDTAAYAFLGYLGWGAKASGPTGGGEFDDTNGSGFARVGYSTYKIQGTGAVSFVQNHPTDAERVVVYHAPEGDEVATYTRGTARLVGGEARVELGESFAWVTNPDLGLTAHLTPQGEAVPLAVVSLTTDELVVRGPADAPADLAFDFIVYGLRIGFESVSVVQEKRREAWIPAMDEHRELYRRHPDLRRHNALERFKDMTARVRGIDAVELDLTGAASLRAAVQEYDRERHGPIEVEPGAERPRRVPQQREGAATESPALKAEASAASPATPFGAGTATPPEAGTAARDTSSIDVSEPVEAGDVLVFDLDSPGSLTVADRPYDTRAAGIAAGDAQAGPVADGGERTLEAPVVFSGVAACKVDASYGAIRPGDLLTTSPTPGHAMVAIDPGPGTVIGKAVESLDAGTATMRVLVMSR